jgi:serine O-acetyltransferase
VNPCAESGALPPPAEEESPSLASIADAMLASYRNDPRAHHINRRFLPSRDEIITAIQQLLQLMYPGYYGRQGLTDENVGYHVGLLLSELRDRLARQVELCLCHRHEQQGIAHRDEAICHAHALQLVTRFLARLPRVRATLVTDVQAAYDGDPAAHHLDEIILAYPGLLAVTVYRLAHELHVLGVPLMPRIMTEWAHAQTGADIHPAADIGPSFFLDHATGAVVGETSDIGASVKLYQGVTLGALSHPRDDGGRVIRGTKRHPTVEDDVTVYANATVLGGNTILGAGSIIGGSVFITRSIPRGSRVALKPPELRVKPTPAVGEPAGEPIDDFEI